MIPSNADDRVQPRLLRRSLSRRALLTGSAAAFLAGRARPLWGQQRQDPFTLGVASGYPTPDGAVLWTRLAPEPLSLDPERPGGMPPSVVPVDWEVAADPLMQQVVRRGTEQADPRFAHSVHVECRGLEPGREYWYRFIVGGVASPTGRLRTAPARGAVAGPAAFRLCFMRELRTRVFLGVSPSGGREPGPRPVSRRLFLRVCRQLPERCANTATGSRRPICPPIATGTLSTRPTRTCRRCMPPSRVSRPGTITR